MSKWNLERMVKEKINNIKKEMFALKTGYVEN